MRKLKIHHYNARFGEMFEEEKKRISKVIDSRDIHHIGSTAVVGLGGKGIVDIMIGIKNWKDSEKILDKLRIIGFRHVHPKEQGQIFLSTKGDTAFGDFHIHIVKKGSKQYKDYLAFRDYLRKHQREAKRYFKLKLEWLKSAKGDRKQYGESKERYIKEILKRAG